MKPLSRTEIARYAANDIHDGWYVNLGIGLPTLVANVITPERCVFLHTENGILNFGPAPASEQADACLINASKHPVSLRPGAAIFDSELSFSMMRGGHLDLAVLGAYQVAQNGDLANWTRNDPRVPPAVGGAMELAYGAKQVWVLMEHTDKNGRPRVLHSCGLPLTAQQVVKRIYTNLAILSISNHVLQVDAMIEGMSLAELQNLTEAQLRLGPACRVLKHAETHV